MRLKLQVRWTGGKAAEPLRWACGQRVSDRIPAGLRGLAIQNDRFWAKWRRNRDAPRSLQQLLKEVEKATQVRRSGLDGVLTELQQHRDAAPDVHQREALTWLCNAVSRLVNNPTAAHSREVLIAADAVKRA